MPPASPPPPPASPCGTSLAQYAVRASGDSEYGGVYDAPTHRTGKAHETPPAEVAPPHPAAASPARRYSADEAVGAPTHHRCGNLLGGSWAPQKMDKAENVLTIRLDKTVYAQRIVITEHANPESATGFVRKIEALTSGKSPVTQTLWEVRA